MYQIFFQRMQISHSYDDISHLYRRLKVQILFHHLDIKVKKRRVSHEKDPF